MPVAALIALGGCNASTTSETTESKATAKKALVECARHHSELRQAAAKLPDDRLKTCAHAEAHLGVAADMATAYQAKAATPDREVIAYGIAFRRLTDFSVYSFKAARDERLDVEAKTKDYKELFATSPVADILDTASMLAMLKGQADTFATLQGCLRETTQTG